MPFLALLHPAQQIGWTAWTVHPSTVVGLLGLLALYELAARRAARTAKAGAQVGAGLSRPGRVDAGAAPSPAQRASFLAALLVIFVALNGPIHDLSDYYLFTGHMAQHLLLTLVMPPLLLKGLTGAMLRPVLLNRLVGPVARRVMRPAMCFALFNVTLAAWHLPEMYNWAMADHGVHIVEHLMFMSTAVLMWWPYLSPVPELPRASFPAQMLYSFVMGLPMSIIAVYIVYSDRLLYPAYASAPRLWGISPLEDQLIGGLLMWVPGGIFLIGILSWVFFRWQRIQNDSVAGAQLGFEPA